jgi:hypothetical protein
MLSLRQVGRCFRPTVKVRGKVVGSAPHGESNGGVRYGPPYRTGAFHYGVDLLFCRYSAPRPDPPPLRAPGPRTTGANVSLERLALGGEGVGSQEECEQRRTCRIGANLEGARSVSGCPRRLAVDMPARWEAAPHAGS